MRSLVLHACFESNKSRTCTTEDSPFDANLHIDEVRDRRNDGTADARVVLCPFDRCES